ncbi:MAG TPA: STAS domain-containing protein [Candidatus Rubrimentiphilum sp.]|nr:STAS domain-containing protein [Candidatus Rubrimentiphilum sp.]
MRDIETRVIFLDGDWDIARRDELERLLKPAYDSPGNLIVDMHAVNYADSTILAALIVLRNRRRSKGLALPSLVIGSRQVRRLLSISGLIEAFPLYETLEEAKAGDSLTP